MKPLARQYITNVYTSWLVLAGRMVLSLILVPFLTRLMGAETYGVWVILFQVVGYFSLLDLGLGSAVVRFVSRHLEPPDDATISRILNTANLMYLGLGLLAFLAAWLFSHWLDSVFDIDKTLAAQAADALTVLGVYLMLRFWLLPFGGSLEAFQRTDLDRRLGFGEDLIRAALLLAVLYLNGTLVHLALVVFGVNLLRQVAGIFMTHRIFRGLRLSLADADRETAIELAKYSRISLGITLCWVVLLNTDGPLLGALVSTAAAGIYRAGAQLVHQLRLVLHGIGGPLIPAVSQLSSDSDPDRIRLIYLRGLRYLSWLTFALCATAALYANDFVALWLPPEFEPAGTVLIILAVGGAFSLPQTIGEAVLFGVSKHSWLLRFLMVEAAMTVVAAVFLIRAYGLIGMAVAAMAVQIGLYLLLYPAVIHRALSIRPSATLRELLLPGVGAALLMVAVGSVVRLLVASDTWTGLIVNVAVALAVGGIVGWRWILSAEDRARLISTAKGQWANEA